MEWMLRSVRRDLFVRGVGYGQENVLVLLSMQENYVLLGYQMRRVIWGWMRPFLAGLASQLLLAPLRRVRAVPLQPCLSMWLRRH